MTKKRFDTSNILQEMVSTSEEEPEEEIAEMSEERLEAKELRKKPPKGYKFNPAYIETKTRRLQLVLRPSLYERVKKRAQDAGLSVNEFIHRILEDATEE